VLDEMNRADLDRCIGELYPLLSGSVTRVHPAGIPLVSTIEMSPRFRIIATINDSTLDDIVFPISEGLARRFQRIELPGASLEDVSSYVCPELDGADPARAAQATQALREFFNICNEEQFLRADDGVDRLPFGAGYFALLRQWVIGGLHLSNPEDEKAAPGLLRDSLSMAGRNKRLAHVLRKMRSLP
jgi:hypothetical protein